MLALNLGMLDVDFDLEHPETHPALTKHLHELAARYQRATGL
jgi:hypothetical protein